MKNYCLFATTCCTTSKWTRINQSSTITKGNLPLTALSLSDTSAWEFSGIIAAHIWDKWTYLTSFIRGCERESWVKNEPVLHYCLCCFCLSHMHTLCFWPFPHPPTHPPTFMQTHKATRPVAKLSFPSTWSQKHLWKKKSDAMRECEHVRSWQQHSLTPCLHYKITSYDPVQMWRFFWRLWLWLSYKTFHVMCATFQYASVNENREEFE